MRYGYAVRHDFATIIGSAASARRDFHRRAGFDYDIAGAAVCNASDIMCCAGSSRALARWMTGCSAPLARRSRYGGVPTARQRRRANRGPANAASAKADTRNCQTAAGQLHRRRDRDGVSPLRYFLM